MNATLLHGISELATPASPGAAHGAAAMRSVRVTHDAAILIQDGEVRWAGPARDLPSLPEGTVPVDLMHRAVVPGLIDPHTHAVWGGDRLGDFESRTSGVPYEEMLAAGGGIWHTIRESADLSAEELSALALPRVDALLRSGATTIEIKSGYGYSPVAELRALEAIRLLSRRASARIIPTLLIHICPKSRDAVLEYRDAVCRDLIPEASNRGLASALDIFIEHHSWSATDAAVILDAARSHDLRVKLHTEQFRSVGGVELGLAHNALSVDHLEVATAEQCRLIGRSQTIATVLPGVTLHLGIPAAPGRLLIDSGAAVAIGTDLNPGSSPLFSASAALALAVRLNGLTPQEALTAATVNAAAALGLTGPGCLAPGLPADLLVLESPHWLDLPYTLGANPVREVWIAGERGDGRSA